jgi:ATP-dependent DNA ligase
MLLRRVAFPDFCEPCLPSPSAKPPAVAKASVGLQLNDHIVEPGDVVFRHACQLGLEGIVSKRIGSPYSSGRSRHWVKSKNREHAAVRREAEEDWGR